MYYDVTQLGDVLSVSVRWVGADYTHFFFQMNYKQMLGHFIFHIKPRDCPVACM